MLPSLTVRDWARRLFAYEDVAGTTSDPVQPATIRVYEKLRNQLSAPVGRDSFQALASRALMLANSESPGLSNVKIMADGTLQGLEFDSQTEGDQDREAGIVLIAQLLGLILSLLGEATTRRLMVDMRDQAVAKPEPDTRAGGTESAREPSASAESAKVVGFESILREVDRLRSTSEALEALADEQPDLEEGLISVAGSIRSIATVLDVFLLIRSKAEGPQPDAHKNPFTRYLM